MADSISYATAPQYLPHNQYYANPHINHPGHGHVHVVVPQTRTEPAQRKRPKYTRSKTGCMTCRVKKIKCDESKPNCMRCTHGQRDCTWPEGVSGRKKSSGGKDSEDGRPSTAGSSGVSEASTPPTRESSPPRHLSADLDHIPQPSSRRMSGEPFLHLQPMNSETESDRRHMLNDRVTSYHHHPSNSNIMPLIPEPSPYSTRYEHSYPSHSSRHTMSSSYRSMGHPPMGGNWSHSTPESINYSYIGHSSPNDGHNRYQ